MRNSSEGHPYHVGDREHFWDRFFQNLLKIINVFGTF